MTETTATKLTMLEDVSDSIAGAIAEACRPARRTIPLRRVERTRRPQPHDRRR